jgi:DELLA protein
MYFENSFLKLDLVCELLEENKIQGAKMCARQLLMEEMSYKTSSELLLLNIFAAALIARMDRKAVKMRNIYLHNFDIPQILLFYKMSEAYPQVASSHMIANQFIEHVIQNMLAFTIFDIGIGKGKQIESLIQTICDKNYNIKEVNIIGLDPDINNIRFTEELFDRLKAEVYFDLNYYPMCNLLENFSDSDYRYIHRIGGENLIINSAYAMHHITHPINDTEFRTDVFRKLKSCNPRLLTLIEPNSNHDIETLTKRAKNCWEHFSVVFSLIDQSDIEDEIKYLVKETFFGREIRDIFGGSDYLRSERHEDLGNWMLKLIKAGFTPYDYQDISINLPSYCDYNIGEGIVRLGYQSNPLIAVFAYQ